MITGGKAGILEDRSAAAMRTFDDILEKECRPLISQIIYGYQPDDFPLNPESASSYLVVPVIRMSGSSTIVSDIMQKFKASLTRE